MSEAVRPIGREPSEPCCEYGPEGHTEQHHHDASACYDATCQFDHPHGGPFPHPCDGPTWLSASGVVQHTEGREGVSRCGQQLHKRRTGEHRAEYGDRFDLTHPACGSCASKPSTTLL